MRLWPWIVLTVGAFCIVRGALDVHAGRYVWGALGILGGGVLILTPIRSRAVKFDVDGPSDR